MKKIFAPIGGLGNHVRWLVLLDQQFCFQHRSRMVSHAGYHGLKEIDWPEYRDYVNPSKNDTEFDPVILSKIQKHFAPHDLDFSSQDHKIRCFQNDIYGPDRSWHNWLEKEWSYRLIADRYVYFNHWIKDQDIENDQNRCLILTVNENLALRHYLKFNNNLNNTSQKAFLLYTKNYQNAHVWLPCTRQHIKMVSVDDLFAPVLSRDFYNQLIDWFELQDNYELANLVHALWFQANDRAQKEFVRDILAFYDSTP